MQGMLEFTDSCRYSVSLSGWLCRSHRRSHTVTHLKNSIYIIALRGDSRQLLISMKMGGKALSRQLSSAHSK